MTLSQPAHAASLDLILNTAEVIQLDQGLQGQLAAPLLPGLFPNFRIHPSPGPGGRPASFGCLVGNLEVQVDVQFIPNQICPQGTRGGATLSGVMQ